MYMYIDQKRLLKKAFKFLLRLIEKFSNGTKKGDVAPHVPPQKTSKSLAIKIQ